MNRALIDTDILSYYFKGEALVCKQFERYLKQYEIIEICIITYYEILSGLLAKGAFKQLAVFDDFVADNIVIPLTEKSTKISAEIYSSLKQVGKPIDDIDLLVAGVAIENDLTLVTNNQKHFGRISGLKVENWRLED